MKRKRKLKNQLQYHAMLLPGVLLKFIFSYVPLFGVIIAFENYTPAGGFASPWVGLANFEFVFRQPIFLRTIRNSFFIAICKIILHIVVPVSVALLLNEVGDRLKRVFQTLVYLPHFISWIILAGILKDFLGLDGLVNQVIQSFGGEAVGFLSKPGIFPWTIILSDCWKGFGFGTVVYLAALTGIDPELYEASMIDGASRWQQTRFITIPLLKPTVVLMTVLSIGGVLNAGFDQIFNLYGPIVYETGDIIDTYVYRLGLESAKFSISSAVGLFKSLVSGTLICVSYFLADKFAGYRIW